MKIDRRSIDRLASLDDESFKSLAMSIASAAGADTRGRRKIDFRRGRGKGRGNTACPARTGC